MHFKMHEKFKKKFTYLSYLYTSKVALPPQKCLPALSSLPLPVRLLRSASAWWSQPW
jgi:hypothetical protein